MEHSENSDACDFFFKTEFNSAVDLLRNIIHGKEATLNTWKEAYKELGNDKGEGEFDESFKKKVEEEVE